MDLAPSFGWWQQQRQAGLETGRQLQLSTPEYVQLVVSDLVEL
ncbi:MAG: hypothetical protein ACYC6R_00195 [Anaerolineales bacterium]